MAKTNAKFATKYPEAATFKPYIPPGDHPEYPSGSAAIYSAFAQAGDDWFLKKFGLKEASKKTGPLSFTIPVNGFYWADGPEKAVTLKYSNLHEWVEELPKSRLYGKP